MFRSSTRQQEKKYAMTGQMTRLIWWVRKKKSSLKSNCPDVGEYSKENLLAFEKEVLGVYLSGHPLQEYEDQMEKIHFSHHTGFPAG